MFKKNRLLKIFSYIFVLAGITLNLITVCLPTTGILLLDFTSWISAIFFIGGIICIYKNKNNKNKLVLESINEYLDTLDKDYKIIEQHTQTDTFLVEIDGVLYNLSVIVSNKELVIMKQLAKQDTNFFIKKQDGSSLTINKDFNYMWEELSYENDKI